MIDPFVSENLLRGIAIGGFAIAGVALALTPYLVPARWVGSVFFLTAIGHVVDNDATLRAANDHASLASWILSALAPALFWAFTIALFTDDMKFPRCRLIPAAMALFLSFAAGLTPPPAAHAFSIAYVALSVALIGHAFVVILRGWQGDLVEARRRLRVPILAAGAAYVLFIAVGDFGQIVDLQLQTTPLFQALALALLAVAAALTFLRVDVVLLGPPVARQSPAAQSRTEMDATDGVMLGRLNRALDEEAMWRQESLTIGALATHLAVPEHRLRRLINGRLGYRNFAALINERRIEAAKVALVDPARARSAIATIAYDLGFGSLGPFNRAFREATGKSPSEWRLSPKMESPPRS